MHYHDPNTYYYEVKFESKGMANFVSGNVIANTRPKALDKIVRKYDCDRNLIKLKCVPCIELNNYVIRLCPKCNSEMIKNEQFCYTSSPPKYEYNCKKCNNRIISE